MAKVQRYLLIILVLALSFSYSACVKENTPPTTSGGTVPVTPDQQKILDLVNEARASGHQCGNQYYGPAPAVAWNTKLGEAAQKHSDYMNSTGNFDHIGANGSDAGERIEAEGYTWITYGENIAEGYPTEEEVVAAWLKSQGHCKNIMNPEFKEMAVATSGSYWTQVFATQQ